MAKALFAIVLMSTLAATAASSKKDSGGKRTPASLSQIRSYYIGHNLTPSSDQIRRNTVTAGTFALGYAPTDGLLLATSPWIWTTYNTKNFHLKYTYTLNPKSDLGFFVSYFDSYDSQKLITTNGSGLQPAALGPPPPGGYPTGANVAAGTNRYQWTSYSGHALYGYHYDNGNIQYFNAKYSYFLNDESPYSLRMDPGDDSIRDQIDFSTLLRIPAARNLSFALESGVLGLNYIKPFAHLGASFCIQNESWLVQLGASYTAPLDEIGTTSAMEIGRFDNRAHYSEVADQYYTERYLQVAVHPEVQLQVNF